MKYNKKTHKPLGLWFWKCSKTRLELKVSAKSKKCQTLVMTHLEIHSVISRERTREQCPVDLLAANLWLFFPCSLSPWRTLLFFKSLYLFQLATGGGHPRPYDSRPFQSAQWYRGVQITSCSYLFWNLLLLFGSPPICTLEHIVFLSLLRTSSPLRLSSDQLRCLFLKLELKSSPLDLRFSSAVHSADHTPASSYLYVSLLLFLWRAPVCMGGDVLPSKFCFPVRC